MAAGWVKLHRQIEDNPVLARDPIAYRIFCGLVLRAERMPRKAWAFGAMREIGRGQILISMRQLAMEMGVPRQQFRTRIDVLKSTQMLTHDITHGMSMLTICNYEIYQGSEISDNPPINPDVNPPVTHDQPTDGGIKGGEGGEGGESRKKGYRSKKTSPETGAANASLPTLRDGPPRLTAREAVEIWNSERGACQGCRWPLSDSRLAHLKARLANGLGTADEWTAYVRRIAATPFLRGDNDRGWKAGLDFAVRAEASARILEGAFDHDARAGPPGSILRAHRMTLDLLDRPHDDEIEPPALPELPEPDADGGDGDREAE